MMSISTAESLIEFIKKNNQKKLITCSKNQFSMIMTILHKYSQILKDRAVIDDSVDVSELDKLIHQLEPDIVIQTLEECEECE